MVGEHDPENLQSTLMPLHPDKEAAFLDGRDQYPQHGDDDVIIPDNLAWPLVISSHLLLVSAIVAVAFARYGLFAVLFAVYVTSIWHWHKPRFSRIARYFDYVAVFTAIGYGSYVALTIDQTYMLVWFIGIAVIGTIFVANEATYYLNARSKDSPESLCGTAPYTIERERVYQRTVCVHLLCVHVMANALALTVVIGSAVK